MISMYAPKKYQLVTIKRIGLWLLFSDRSEWKDQKFHAVALVAGTGTLKNGQKKK